MQTSGASVTRSPRAVLLALVLGTALYLAYLALAPGSATSVTAVNDIGQAVVPLLIAAPALVTAARRSTGRQRTSWRARS